MEDLEYLFFPKQNGDLIRDIDGNTVFYTSREALIADRMGQYDSVLIYALDDVVSREEFEKFK